jgi:antitoxin VapB
MQSAKLFINGHSQAVRLPKAFRFEGVTEVAIERDGEALILRPIKPPSIERLIDALDKFEDFPEREQPEQSDQREAW